MKKRWKKEDIEVIIELIANIIAVIAGLGLIFFVCYVYYAYVEILGGWR